MYVRVGTRNITPSGTVYLVGHAIRTDVSIGVADDIEVNTMVIEDDKDTFVWISVELVGMELSAVNKIRETIAEKYNVNINHIMHSVTHTHAAPDYTVGNKMTPEGSDVMEGYSEFLMEQVLLSVDDAFSKEKIACEPYMATMQVEGVYSNRNGLEYYYDPTLWAVKWIDENDMIQGGFINFNCHATVLGPLNLEVSGDLFGYLRRKIAADWGVNPLMLQSSSGDVSNRQHRQGNDYVELTRVGEALYAQMKEKLVYKKIDFSLISETIYHYEDHYETPMEVHLGNLEKTKQNIETAPNYDIKKIFTSAHAYVKRLVDNNITKFDVSFDCYIYDFTDFVICTFPAELNSILGKVIKESRTDKPVLIWGYCNDTMGYIVEEAMHGLTYEGISSRIRKGNGEQLATEIAEIVKGM